MPEREVLMVNGYQRGKLVNAGGERIFYRDVCDRVRIRFCDAWALETSVLDWLDRQGVLAIHYYDTEAKVLYTTDVSAMRSLAIVRTMNGRQQALLPRRYWLRGLRHYSPMPWVSNIREVNA